MDGKNSPGWTAGIKVVSSKKGKEEGNEKEEEERATGLFHALKHSVVIRKLLLVMQGT